MSLIAACNTAADITGIISFSAILITLIISIAFR